MSDIVEASPFPARRASAPAALGSGAWGIVGIGVTVVFLCLFLLAPLVVVFSEAFAHGPAVYFNTFLDSDARSAVYLTLTIAAISVPLNAVFGLTAAWAIAKFEFVGKSVLITLIDLPFSVSPVVSGLIFVLVFGAQGVLGPWVAAHNLHIIFAVPGIVLATVFVTFPFVARELIPLMQSQGSAEEEAALHLGRARLPNLFRRHAAEREVGAALWRAALQRPRHGRVRRRFRRFRPHPRPHQHHPAPGGDSLQ